MLDTNLSLNLDATAARSELSHEQIASITPLDCTKCDRCSSRKHVVRGSGSYSPKVMFIGLQPGPDEDQFGRSGMGERGMMLNRVFARAGVAARDVYMTHLVKCRTAQSKTKKPSIKEIRDCKPYLDAEIAALNPKLVILEGPDVLKVVLGDRKLNMNLVQGARLRSDSYPGIQFMPSFVIESIFADYNYEAQMVNNLRRAVYAIDNPNVKPIPTAYLSIDTEEQLDQLFTMLADVEHLSLDIESDGGETFQTTKTVCWSIAWAPGKAAYFPWLDDGNVHHWDDSSRPRIVAKWNKFLKNKKLVLHNGKYDIKILRYDVGLTEGEYYFDTVISSNLIDETQMSLKLKNLAWLYTDMGGYDDALEGIKQKLGITHDYSLIPRDILKKYAMGDADCTFRLFDAHRKLLTEKKMDFLMYGLNMPVSRIFLDLEYRGVKVDIPYLENLRDSYTKQLKDLEVQIHRTAGIEFDVTSSKQMSEVLFRKLKLPVQNVNKTQESSDKNALNKLKGKHPVIELILQHRSLSTLLNNFITTLLDLSDKDGFVHTTYNVGTQSTGRTSSAKPNLQNLPRSNKDIKKAFITRPGYVYYEFDFSQIEIRVLAHLSQDPKLIADLRSGTDIHRTMASTVYGVPFDKVTSEMRSNAKSVSFGIIYGMSWKTLAESKGMTDVAAKKLYNNFFTGYSGVANWIEDVKDFARKYRCVYTPLGRIRHLDSIDHPIQSIRGKCERCAVNSPIQSMGADIPNLALIKLLQEFPPEQHDYRFCFQIHDAVILEMRQDTAEELAKKIKRLLETAEPLVVPTPTGCKRGPNLGEMEEIELAAE